MESQCSATRMIRRVSWCQANSRKKDKATACMRLRACMSATSLGKEGQRMIGFFLALHFAFVLSITLVPSAIHDRTGCRNKIESSSSSSDGVLVVVVAGRSRTSQRSICVDRPSVSAAAAASRSSKLQQHFGQQCCSSSSSSACFFLIKHYNYRQQGCGHSTTAAATTILVRSEPELQAAQCQGRPVVPRSGQARKAGYLMVKADS